MSEQLLESSKGLLIALLAVFPTISMILPFVIKGVINYWMKKRQDKLEEALQEQLDAIQKSNEQMHAENIQLRQDLKNLRAEVAQYAKRKP